MFLPDYEKYRALINDPTLTDEQKDEYIRRGWMFATWLIDAIYDGRLSMYSSKENTASKDEQPNSSEKSEQRSSLRARKKRKSSR